MLDARLDRVQHRLAAFMGRDVEFHHGRLTRHDLARPRGEIAGDRPEMFIRQQEDRTRASPAVGAQAQCGGHLRDAAEAQVVRQVVDLGAHHRGDFAFQRIAREQIDGQQQRAGEYGDQRRVQQRQPRR